MADEYEIFEFLESDNTETIKKQRLRRMQLRNENDPFNLDEIEFIKRYSLTKDLARNLCEELRPFMKSPLKSTDLSIETRVLIALSFYATGSYQRPTGDNEGHFVAQQTVSNVITKITACLNRWQFQKKYIRFPSTDQECHRIKTEFHNKFGIPGVLGCIDCTHVAIVRPKLNDEHYYIRKNSYSLNVQMVCDANMQILSVDASHGGATHNSFIWATHPLRSQIEDLSAKEDTWFLGDSKYPLRTTMMTPIDNAEPDSPEAHYNDLHGCARNTMQHTIELLKARFRCLLIHKLLHYSPEVAGSIFNACVILHNICNTANVPQKTLTNAELIQEAQLHELDSKRELARSNSIAFQLGLATRCSLITSLWEKRNVKLKLEYDDEEDDK